MPTSSSSSWWSCVCAGCAPSSTPQLELREIPASALSPLFFCWRCGALSVFDTSLRALLAIAPFSRALLKRVPFVIEPLAALRERIRECDARLQRAKGELGAGQEPQEATQPPESQRKRKRSETTQTSAETATSSGDCDSHSPPSRPPEEVIAALEAEEAALQRQLRDEMRRWEQFAAETTDPSTLLLQQQQQQHQGFSATHLNILKVMYDKSMDKVELAALAHQIEQFLLHQSTLLKMKFDVLAAVDSCREAEQLHAPAFQDHGYDRSTRERHNSGTMVSMDKVTNLIINSTKEQLRHRYDTFQALSRPHLALVGVANTHLFALEKRRLVGGYEAVSHVQQSLERGNRIAEISKKVELWRALSATISSTCVLSVLELASATDSPLAW